MRLIEGTFKTSSSQDGRISDLKVEKNLEVSCPKGAKCDLSRCHAQNIYFIEAPDLQFAGCYAKNTISISLAPNEPSTSKGLPPIWREGVSLDECCAGNLIYITQHSDKWTKSCTFTRCIAPEARIQGTKLTSISGGSSLDTLQVSNCHTVLIDSGSDVQHLEYLPCSSYTYSALFSSGGLPFEASMFLDNHPPLRTLKVLVLNQKVLLRLSAKHAPWHLFLSGSESEGSAQVELLLHERSSSQIFDRVTIRCVDLELRTHLTARFVSFLPPGGSLTGTTLTIIESLILRADCSLKDTTVHIAPDAQITLEGGATLSETSLTIQPHGRLIARPKSIIRNCTIQACPDSEVEIQEDAILENVIFTYA